MFQVKIDEEDHFRRKEFACKCGCGFDVVDAELLNFLKGFRRFLNLNFIGEVQIEITSGCRCLEYNEKVQLKVDPAYDPYSSKSQHMLGKAADVVFLENFGKSYEVIPIETIYKFLLRFDAQKINSIFYELFVHFDVRHGKRKMIVTNWKNL